MNQPAREPGALRPLLQTAGVLAAGALIWFVGPLVAVAGRVPLASEAARAWALAALLALSLGSMAAHSLRARRRNRQLLDGLVAGADADTQPGTPETVQAPTPEVELLGRRFQEAVAQLKRARIGRRRGLAAWARPYVYELPWYVIIGAPGAGKTTALVNSGLEFPLADQPGAGQALRGVGGTRNCDWWFTDQAVLIDTAGRYTTQDSHQAADRAAWLGVLDLLKRYRPRRPVNGVLLTVSVADLLGASPQARQAHARALRERIAELQRHLGIRFPVYVLVTKTDLLAGFMEFFADLDKDERAQVWGFTLPAEGGPADPLPLMSSELAALEKRLNEHLLERLHAEADRDRRAALFAFPQQWRLLHELLLELLQAAFGPASEAASAPRDAATAPPLLRGVYFTSATQEGTPIDRALGGIARTLGLSGRLLLPARPSGKSFFVTRLLRDVVFAEAGLAGLNLRWMRRRALAQLALGGLSVVAAAAVLALGWRAYADNHAYLADAARQLPALRHQAQAARASAPTDLVALMPVLDGAERFARQTATGAAGPSLGLDQRELLSAAADDAYARLLHEAFLPRVAARLEARLRSGSPEHVELVYEALRAYLMLFAGRNFDAAALRADLDADWDATVPATPAQRAALRRHLQRLLAGGEVGAPEAVDPQLIARARALVAGVPVADRVFRRLQQGDAGAPAFSIASATGPSAPKLFARASGRPLEEGVPGFYTRAVYPQRLRERTREALRQLERERAWVLGTAGARAMPVAAVAPTAPATPSVAEAPAPSLAEAVERLYLAEHARQWESFIGDLRLAATPTLAASAEVAQALARPDSPLAALLRAVAREVAVSPVLAPRHEPLSRFVAGQPAPLDDTLSLLGSAGQQLAVIDDAVRRRTLPPPGPALKNLAAAAQQAPEPVNALLGPLAAAGGAQALAALHEPLSRQLSAEVGAACSRSLDNRYPFARGAAQEVSREDFVRFFGAGGMIDEFVQRRLVPYGADATPAAFQRARQVRDAFFTDGGRRFGVQLELRLLELDPALSEFVIDIDGQAHRFRREARAPQRLRWPASEDAPGRVTLRTGASGGYGFDGPWALLRLFDRVRIEPGAGGRVELIFDVEGRKARFEARSATALNPVLRSELESFPCPRRL
ncbi:type VI secretion system membrane subunit TssM [Azohydromonas caseinilytica]|uniref:Type VI secretion system membrane subunit TssM n=1 Tax=Azohydromonas caseinilytica TaxID=2728836 RepID=A0A848F2J1_9BURK|nr:type VI secretion system membrane subunit TssM [Azohydromonas caseinilytica]NML13622.1 type VI secretion system membrane subunit TssM [Azohydromonas caseinilytica]